MCSIKVVDGWIRTRVLCYRKRPLCQLRHNHCPLPSLLFISAIYFSHFLCSPSYFKHYFEFMLIKIYWNDWWLSPAKKYLNFAIQKRFLALSGNAIWRSYLLQYVDYVGTATGFELRPSLLDVIQHIFFFFFTQKTIGTTTGISCRLRKNRLPYCTG